MKLPDRFFAFYDKLESLDLNYNRLQTLENAFGTCSSSSSSLHGESGSQSQCHW